MDIRKLQRAIVDGLEDVKAQDIQVYNTEHLSALFERVIIASGTSNRQTKALASSVRNAVRSQGLPVLATEGSDNGEWIIVDCGAAVAHIMQPAIRDYYRLEEIWGGKPVKIKLDDGAPKGLPKAESVGDDEDDEPVAAVRKPAARKTAPARGAAPAKQAAPAKRAAPAKKATAGRTPPAKPSTGKAPAKTAARGGGAPATSAAPRKAAAKKASATRSTSTRGAAGSPARKAAAGKTASKTARKAPSRG
jgi:ribosome-associated protein